MSDTPTTQREGDSAGTMTEDNQDIRADCAREREAAMSGTVDIGQVAYEGYCAVSDGKSLVSGAPLPAWGEQAPEIREAWRAAADAVLMFNSVKEGE